MAEEEFQESEVLFSDQNSNHCGTHDEAADVAVKDDGVCFNNPGSSRSFKSDKTNKKKKKTVAISLPLNIQHHHGGGTGAFHCGGEFDEYDDGEMEPPHVVLARRLAGKMAFSVCTGNGRTLKGRDLSQVRNSVLRMTGFLEA